MSLSIFKTGGSKLVNIYLGRKEAILKKLLPPLNQSVSAIAQQEQIANSKLYKWLKESKKKGLAVLGNQAKNTQHRSNEARLAVIIETASMNQFGTSEDCRQKGLFIEQLNQLKAEMTQPQAQEMTQLKQAQSKIKELQKELNRKEKALPEAAALLVLQEKEYP